MNSGKVVYTDIVLFPAAAAFAMVAVPLWLAMLQGWLTTPGIYWHGHELLFG